MARFSEEQGVQFVEVSCFRVRRDLLARDGLYLSRAGTSVLGKLVEGLGQRVIVYLEPAQIHGSQLCQLGNGNIVKYLVQIQSDPCPQGAQLLQYHRCEQHLDSRPATS